MLKSELENLQPEISAISTKIDYGLSTGLIQKISSVDRSPFMKLLWEE